MGTLTVAHNFATGLWPAKWLSKTKTCSNQFFPNQGCTFEIAKETFVHNHQNRVTDIRTVALMKE